MFDFDDLTTWPKALISLLDSNLHLLENHKAREFEINAMNFPARWKTLNEYSADYQFFLERLSGVTGNLSFCAYHATRLTDSEITDIQENGLKPLLKIGFLTRLQKAVNSGSLTEKTADKISKSNSDLENRKNQVWFVCGKNALKNEYGIANFLSYWGGEAIFQNFDESEDVLSELKLIGQPYLIKGFINQSEFKLIKAEIFKHAYLNADSSDSKGVDIMLVEKFSADRIEKIISFGDKEFLKLTEHPKWDRVLS